MTNLLIDNYFIIKNIGSGSFGDVYEADSEKYGKVALKVESNKSSSRIITEYKIYKELQVVDSTTVNVYELIETDKHNIMSMELLGESIDMMFNKNNKQFPISVILFIGLRMIQLIETLHSIGYIHRDIKPGNFLFRPGSNEICVIDFGLSRKYIIENNHIKMRTGRSLVGTARYASTNIHMGFEPSRRDDIESIGYVMLYLAKGILPWQGLKGKGKKDSIKLIGNRKMGISVSILCEEYPSCIKKIITHARNLTFTEAPDYKYLIKSIQRDMLRLSKNCQVSQL